MPDLIVGGLAADVEPDFKGFRPALKRGLAAAERDAEVSVKVLPNVTKAFMAQLKADLRKQSGALTVPVTPSV